MSANQIELLEDELQKLEIAQNTTLKDLYDIQFQNPPSNVRLPSANSSNTYDIDLSTRTVSAPEFLSVEKDHKSTVIYFRVDKYFDFMDLSNTVCVIEYIPPNVTKQVPYMYVVPFFDTTSQILENKILFPWVLGNQATSHNGTLKYAIRFFRLEENAIAQPKLIYDLRTLPAESVILTGLEVNTEDMQKEYDNITSTMYEDGGQQWVESTLKVLNEFKNEDK